MTAEPLARQTSRLWAVDLTFDETGVVFSTPHPNPDESVEITVRLINAGLEPLGAVSLVVSFTGPVAESQVMLVTERV